MPLTKQQQQFVDRLMPAAMEASRKTGVDPRIIVAQAAQETGWGRSAPNNNYFGIKSHGKPGGSSLMTHEYENGKRVNKTQSFRGYESPEDSVAGYAQFITENPRYGKFRAAGSFDEQLAELQKSGYATDPRYAQSVGQIARNLPLGERTALAAIEQAVPGNAPNPMAYSGSRRPSGLSGAVNQVGAMPKFGSMSGFKAPRAPSIFQTAMRGAMGAGQQFGAGIQQQLAKPEVRRQALFNTIFKPGTPRSNPYTPQGVVNPGGDAVLKALMTRDVGNTNSHFADSVGRSEKQINTYRENKRKGLI